MRRNLGWEDRLFRVILALSILPLALLLDGHARMLGWLGFEPLLAALFGWSPFYAVLGLRTFTADKAAPLPPTVSPAASAI